ncbi:Steryl acetyl hydrolase 1 [Talaromyces pinophilus]|nr:Steryl acetyl hydrolase 1 [Talaromyces pinophilus]
MTATSQQPAPGSLTLWGWLCLLAKVGGIVAGLIFKAVRYPFLSRKSKTKRSFHHYIAYEGMIDFQSGLSAVEKHTVLPSTAWQCKSFAHGNNLPYEKVTLHDGTLAFLLNGSSSSTKHALGLNPFTRGSKKAAALADEMVVAKQKANKVIVYFHGGGYVAAILPQHLHLIYSFEDKPRYKDGVVVYVLAYGLVDEKANHYPTQLRQAISLLNHIINTENIPPSNITLMGNSAGANLLLSVILHLSHPNPDVPPLNMKDEKFAAAVAISPWCNMDTSAESMTTNANKDVLAASALEYWGGNFLGGRSLDPWNSPLQAPAEWWTDLKVGELLMIYGEDEIMRDDTEVLCKRVQSAHPQTTVYGLPGESHEQMAMTKLLHLPWISDSEKIYTAWMKERFY